MIPMVKYVDCNYVLKTGNAKSTAPFDQLDAMNAVSILFGFTPFIHAQNKP